MADDITNVDVDEVAVLPEYQGFGIGGKLLNYAAKGASVYNLPIVLMSALGKETDLTE